VSDFLARFGRNPRREQAPSSDFWRIDLRSLGGPITALARVALNLPRKSQKPVRDEPRAHDTRRDDGVRHEDVRRDELRRDETRREDRRREDVRGEDLRREDLRREDLRRDEGRRSPAGGPPRARPGHDNPQAMMQPDDRGGTLAVHGIEKSFAGRKVVKGVSLFVRRGEAVGLLGPNGAGKTTVFYMITGLIKADRGRVDLDGFNISDLPMYQRARLGIGYLPQEASIFRGLTVEDNIRSVLEIVEPNKRRREAELNNLLEEFHITGLRKSPSIALSGGERRRVEIARALASRPNYMLLDEPFAGIDPIAVGDIQALVRHLTSRGIGVLITDHNVRETLGLTDRAYIIYSGQVLMEGRTEDIVNDPEVRRVYLGEQFRL
jgi:lipopolysaccharide export system ATP-binding protein